MIGRCQRFTDGSRRFQIPLEQDVIFRSAMKD